MSTLQQNVVSTTNIDPVSKEEKEFLAEIEVMDLSPIKDKTYVVAVGTGDPNKVKFLCSTIHGPYNFTEMCQEVGEMWVQHQHHAKVIIMEKTVSISRKDAEIFAAYFENENPHHLVVAKAPVPSVVMGGSSNVSSTSRQSEFEQMMGILAAKAAKDLTLDMKIK